MGQILHGIDLVDFPRIEQMVERHGKRFVNRIFTPAEQEYAKANKNSVEKLAGRFAAKEAAMKALGTGWNHGVSWKDIEVANCPDGCPSLSLAGGALKHARQLGYRKLHVSMSHTRRMAVAEVIIED